MSTLVLDARSLADSLSDAASSMATGIADSAPRISFATPKLLWEVLTAERWALLKAIGGAYVGSGSLSRPHLPDVRARFTRDTQCFASRCLRAQRGQCPQGGTKETSGDDVPTSSSRPTPDMGASSQEV